MRKFISFVLLATITFLGVGAVVERAGAAFRSDDKALAIISRARTAIGGDGVRSLTISARSSKTIALPDGAKTIDGDLSVALELPNRLQKTLRAGDGNGQQVGFVTEVMTTDVPPVPGVPPTPGAAKVFVMKDGKMTDGNGNVVFMRTEDPSKTETVDESGQRRVVLTRTAKADANGNVVVMNGNPEKVDDANVKKIIINKSEQRIDGAGGHGNELLRLTLSLLARAPEGTDAAFAYAGESSVDGRACDLVSTGAGDAAITLCFDRASGLPSSMTYKSPKPFVIRMDKPAAAANGEVKDVRVVTSNMPAGELAEYVVKFSDFRSVDGVTLPFAWTQTVGGQADETTTVTSYGVNPADIASKFSTDGGQKFVVVTKPKK